MYKKIVFAMILLALSITISYGYDIEQADYYLLNENTGYSVVINDEADLLSGDEISLLSNDMFPLTEFGNIVFLSTTYPSTSQHKIANDYYYELFGTASGSVLLIDMYERIVYIYSDGSNLKTITSSKAEIITDNIYQYLSDKKYYDGASIAFSQIYTLLNRW